MFSPECNTTDSAMFKYDSHNFHDCVLKIHKSALSWLFSNVSRQLRDTSLGCLSFYVPLQLQSYRLDNYFVNDEKHCVASFDWWEQYARTARFAPELLQHTNLVHVMWRMIFVLQLLNTSRSPLVALTILKKICDHPRLLSTRQCKKLGLFVDDK